MKARSEGRGIQQVVVFRAADRVGVEHRAEGRRGERIETRDRSGDWFHAAIQHGASDIEAREKSQVDVPFHPCAPSDSGTLWRNRWPAEARSATV